jgi:(p)ppGpp synthase/HD superfamily hydrolase
MTESAAALNGMDRLLFKIENAVVELDDVVVAEAATEWKKHVDATRDARAKVKAYLVNTKAGADVNAGYDVAKRLLDDLDFNAFVVHTNWRPLMEALKNGTGNADEFVEHFHRDIGRFKELERKFDEWIRQFKVRK